MAPNNTGDRSQMSWDQLVAPCGRQQLPPAKHKVETNNRLGTYNAAVTPLLVLMMGIACGTYAYKDFPLDPRVKGWLLIENPIGMLVISVTYILASVVWGPRWMEGRKPMQLKGVMIAYNFFQVVFSLYMFVETGLVGWFFDYNYRCQPCDYSLSNKAVRMTRVAHWFFLSKLLDFVDTALFILRGKLSQVTMLHVIHHSCMFMSMWFGIHHTPGGHITFMGFLNTFVHTVMYTYYLLAAFGPRMQPYLWWKRYLTKLQLTQFVLIFLHAAQLLVFPCEGVPTSLVLWTLLYAFIFFALFINFYVRAYLFGEEKPKPSSAAPVKAKDSEDSFSSSKNILISNGPSHPSEANGRIAQFMESRTKHRIPTGATMTN
ncbi:elongation of very long chain fatty acids protein 7-like [Hyalella azteca]|uniref:Elongation of very long chain fatty acids protein n=1 Tax=Hyalella azteca TaxID=294128 RepID=A0A8B7PEU3_HYAAZ|nr:elongation of very long chain fatty acids protein 7-like [Hyalella azteca]